MNKVGQATAEDVNGQSGQESTQETLSPDEKITREKLRKNKEDEIRRKLDAFAKELTQARKQRQKH